MIHEITIVILPEQVMLIEVGSSKGKDIIVSDYGLSFTPKEETAAYSTCAVAFVEEVATAQPVLQLVYKYGHCGMRGKHMYEGEPGLLANIQIRKEAGELCPCLEKRL